NRDTNLHDLAPMLELRVHMTLNNKPDNNTLDPASLDEMQRLVGDSRPNVLLRAANEAIDAALDHIARWIGTPLHVCAGQVQVISATDTDLFAAVEQGKFSGKLYYRLNMILAEIGVVNEREA